MGSLRHSNRPVYGKARPLTPDDAVAPENVNKTAGPAVRDFGLVFFKYRLLILVTFLATIAGTLLWLWLRSDSYETTAKVMIKFAREVTDPRTSLSPTSSATSKMMAVGRVDINTEAELIKSFSVLQQVVTKLGLAQVKPEVPPPGLLPRVKFELRRAYHGVKDLLDTAQTRMGLKEALTPYEAAVITLAQGLKVEAVKESSIVNVTLSSPYKQGAGEIVNTLLTLYREHRLSLENEPGEIVFFQNQAEQYRAGLQKKEDALKALKKQYDITSLPDQTGLIIRNISDAEKAYRENLESLAAAEARVQMLRARLSHEEPNRVVSETDARNKQLDELEARRATLELEKQRLLARFDESRPPVQEVQRQIDRLNEIIRTADKRVQESKTTALNATYMELEKELLNATQSMEISRARVRAQEETMTGYKNRLKNLQEVETSYNRLVRDIAVIEEAYRLHEKNAMQSRSAEAMNSRGITSIEIVDPAVDPILPAGLRKTYLFGGAIAVGLILGLGLAYIADSLDNTVCSSEEAENSVGAPVLAVLHRQRPTVLYPPPDEVLPPFRTVASLVDAFSSRTAPCVLTFCGASLHAGSTVATLGTGWVLSSEFSRKTLVLPMNLNNLRVADLKKSGSRITLPGSDNIEAVSLNTNLHVATDRVFPDAPEEVLADHVRGVPERFPGYSLYLIAAPFSLPQHHRSGVAKGSSAVIVVAEVRETRIEVLRRLRHELERQGANTLGTILNERRLTLPPAPDLV